MNATIFKWFLKVDINPNIINESGFDYDGVPWAKRFWRVAYRDARERARITNHSLTELMAFRNLGVLKKVWHPKSGNCIGRFRSINLSEFDNNTIALKVGLSDYNPNRIIG